MSLLRSRLHALVLATCNVFQCPLEVLPGVFEARCVFIRVEVGMNEFDETIKVFGGHLELLVCLHV